jgi:hypothetical protein
MVLAGSRAELPLDVLSCRHTVTVFSIVGFGSGLYSVWT